MVVLAKLTRGSDVSRLYCAVPRRVTTVSAIDQPGKRQTLPLFVFGLMASVTFVGILSELMPSGILPQMTEGLGVTESQVGFLVGVYALASAICAIPLVRAQLGRASCRERGCKYV